MDEELIEILKLFTPHHPVLTFNEISLLLDKPASDIAQRLTYLNSQRYLQPVGGYIPSDGTLAVDTQLQLTYLGKMAVDKFKDEHKRQFWSEFRAWVTLAISICALVLSFIALISQSG